MDILNLDVQKRNKELSAKALREGGVIPAEYYGKGVENISLQMDYQAFRKVFREAGGNTVVALKLDGEEDVNVLIHEVSFDPVTDAIVHVDFGNVIMGEELHTKIPFEFTGTSIAVKDMQGTLVTHLSELEVKCLPKDLVHSIEVDLSVLEDFHLYIRIKDINIPEGMTVLNEMEDVVANVAAPRVEEVDTPVVGVVAEGEEGAEGEGEDGEKKEEGAE